jgi:esterase
MVLASFRQGMTTEISGSNTNQVTAGKKGIFRQDWKGDAIHSLQFPFLCTMSLPLHFRKTGSGPPLLILHGVFGSGENWLTVSKFFQNTFTVYLIDQRNHGRSPQSDAFSYDLLVEDVLAFANEHGLSTFSLIGHSMGGKVAMKFAGKYPERLEKLIIVDIAPRYYAPHHEAILAAFHAVNLNLAQSRAEAEAAMEPFVAEPDVRQFLLKNLYRQENGTFAWRINLPVLDAFAANIGEAFQPKTPVKVDTLFIKGGNSRYISDKDVLKIKELFPFSRLEIIDHAGHWVQAEQPETFAGIVLSFLQPE